MFQERQVPRSISRQQGRTDVEKSPGARRASDNNTHSHMKFSRQQVPRRARFFPPFLRRAHAAIIHLHIAAERARSQPPQHALDGCALKCIAPVARRRKTIKQMRSFKTYLLKTT